MSRVFDFFEEYDIIRLEGKFVEKFFNCLVALLGTFTHLPELLCADKRRTTRGVGWPF